MEVNLCKEIKEEMEKLNIKKEIIDFIKNNHLFIQNYSSPINVQKIIMITLLFKLLMCFKYPISSEIRLALNASSDSMEWLKDIKIGILPFIKENEEFFSI